ncbi:salicylic acid-binding protein 2-like isoform X1 [Olea europaea var. sylvestris]|uniref:salicylic acid-binding protein 2-like isoform X1 n=1 Tax=Olea europaea var. sylvestris TaxID=158386 RepID=UPI000C1D54CB|nr:salicylic acid-binding protein 2-like isoform X1 [Olea europaea var. sylvestris]
MEEKQQRHFVLVHGACLGAWSWYKLQPLLKAAGHYVTVLDLSASCIDPRSLDELCTFPDYTLPLFKVMESIPPDEKVVLIGHSLGGLNLAFAMEKYPEKISLAVFLGATMPDTIHRPSYVLEKYLARTPAENFSDTQFAPFGRPEDHLQSILFGPQYISSRIYQLSPAEDVALAISLVRPASLFMQDLSNRSPFSNKRFGFVKRAYIITGKDKAISPEFQHWEIKNTGVTIVKEIEDADHMAMISKPHTLCQYLLDIAK